MQNNQPEFVITVIVLFVKGYKSPNRQISSSFKVDYNNGFRAFHDVF